MKTPRTAERMCEQKPPSKAETRIEINLDTSHIDQVEHNIAPPMASAITLPVDGLHNVAVYVARSPFGGADDVTDRLLKEIASQLQLNSKVAQHQAELDHAWSVNERYQASVIQMAELLGIQSPNNKLNPEYVLNTLRAKLQH